LKGEIKLKTFIIIFTIASVVGCMFLLKVIGG
jgi:hypothetical protein